MSPNRPSISPLPAIVLAAACVFIAATVKVPYAFYGYMRWIVFIACIYGAFCSAEGRKSTALWILIAVGILLNPIAELRMHRAQWQPIDIAAAIALLVAAALLKQERKAIASAGAREPI
jgi:hypothetical protein